MGSTLTVDNIVGATTAANVKMPVGTVLQKIITQTNSNQAINSTSFVGVSSLTASITPKFANSRLVVTVHLPAVYLQATARHMYWTVYRDVAGGGYANIGLGSGKGIGLSSANTGGGNNWGGQSGLIEDTGRASNTSVYNYRVYIKNGSQGAIDYIAEGNTTNSIIVEEISV